MKGKAKCQVPEGLPDFFCWTKFGVESGEEVQGIFYRKDLERRHNGGLFLWGIGQSIRPSLPALLALVATPEVMFSPIRSAPSRRDVEPEELLVWAEATGYDGVPYRLPDYSLVTSRSSAAKLPDRHFALVCHSDVALAQSIRSSSLVLASGQVRNLRSGSALGASQVTSVVRRVSTDSDAGTEYQVTARASLVYPYLVELSGGSLVPASLRLDRIASESLDARVQALVQWKNRRLAISRKFEQLALI